MFHANATLTPKTRLRLARLVVEQGWTCSSAAKMFMVFAYRGEVGRALSGRGTGRDGGTASGRCRSPDVWGLGLPPAGLR